MKEFVFHTDFQDEEKVKLILGDMPEGTPNCNYDFPKELRWLYQVELLTEPQQRFLIKKYNCIKYLASEQKIAKEDVWAADIIRNMVIQSSLPQLWLSVIKANKYASANRRQEIFSHYYYEALKIITHYDADHDVPWLAYLCHCCSKNILRIALQERKANCEHLEEMPEMSNDNGDIEKMEQNEEVNTRLNQIKENILGSKLTKSHKTVMFMRLGLSDGIIHSFESIGEKLGVTRQAAHAAFTSHYKSIVGNVPFLC